jgi:competence protein ComFC
MPINPIKLLGNWEEGYAMDVHVINSIYIGDNEYGYPEYDTTRSEIGELVYLLKYRRKENAVCDKITLIDPFLRSWDAIKNVDIVIPVPPTKKHRLFQPVYLIAEEIAGLLGKPISSNLLERISSEQIKGLAPEAKIERIRGTIIKHKKFSRKVDLLLVDDLYETGATLMEICNVLRRDTNVNNIYVLTMTKTKG